MIVQFVLNLPQESHVRCC